MIIRAASGHSDFWDDKHPIRVDALDFAAIDPFHGKLGAFVTVIELRN